MESFAQLLLNGGYLDNILIRNLAFFQNAVIFISLGLVLDEYHRHAFTDLVPGLAGEDLGTLAVQGNRHVRSARL